jgi:hypothetical protein
VSAQATCFAEQVQKAAVSRSSMFCCNAEMWDQPGSIRRAGIFLLHTT